MKICFIERVEFDQHEIDIINEAIRIADDIYCDCETQAVTDIASKCFDALSDLLALRDIEDV